ncbi:porin [Blattabacterium cuenoti]|uniref:porin n=1 Tax=Blattabacterium cuenoti TaxID=1653831 RepID=UPI00163B7CBD|nr:porin [Blattabacterium cuenoti]
MRKTKIIFLVLFLGFFYPFHSFAKIINQKKTTDENPHFHIFLDFSGSIKSISRKEFIEESCFSEDKFNLELIGKATDKISYHFVKTFKNTIKNPEIVDLAYLKYKWNDKSYFLFGKQPLTFSKVEHINNVHKNNGNAFGFSFLYFPIKDHEFQLQIVNDVVNKKTEYDDNEHIISEVKKPMGYSMIWNWNLNQVIQNKCSYAIFQQKEKGKYWKLLVLGSKLNWKPVTIEAEYILSNEDLEKNMNVTKQIQSISDDKYFISAKYGTYFVKLKYNFLPKWNFIAEGVYEKGFSKDAVFNEFVGENELFKREYVYYGGIEFVPTIKKNKNDDLSFYFSCRNQIINYRFPKMKEKNENNYFIVLGLNYRIKMI